MKTRMKRVVGVVVVVLLLAGAGAYWYFSSGRTRATELPAKIGALAAGALGTLPKPRSVIVIVEENKSYDQIVAEPEHAPYINALAKQGALFTHSYGVAHPSQPNYFAMFAGRINDNGDGCPATGIPADAPNLGAEVIASHHAFRAYAEDLPRPGFSGCASGEYARKHAPWTNFTNVPPHDAVPFSELRSYDALPDVTFIVPNQLDDMHSASIERGDAWLRVHADPLVAWAKRHDALVILTWDESSEPLSNHIPTIFVGPMVKPGRYDEQVDHYRVLRTIEDLVRIPTHAGHAADVPPIADVWR
jgi:acid phosphatase